MFRYMFHENWGFHSLFLQIFFLTRIIILLKKEGERKKKEGRKGRKEEEKREKEGRERRRLYLSRKPKIRKNS